MVFDKQIKIRFRILKILTFLKEKYIGDNSRVGKKVGMASFIMETMLTLEYSRTIYQKAQVCWSKTIRIISRAFLTKESQMGK